MFYFHGSQLYISWSEGNCWSFTVHVDIVEHITLYYMYIHTYIPTLNAPCNDAPGHDAVYITTTFSINSCPNFHGYSNIDTNSTVAISYNIGNNMLHYYLMIHRNAFGRYCVKRWDYTQLHISCIFTSSLGQSWRSCGISGADGMGNLVPSGCYACVIGYR